MTNIEYVKSIITDDKPAINLIFTNKLNESYDVKINRTAKSGKNKGKGVNIEIRDTSDIGAGSFRGSHECSVKVTKLGETNDKHGYPIIVPSTPFDKAKQNTIKKYNEQLNNIRDSIGSVEAKAVDNFIKDNQAYINEYYKNHDNPIQNVLEKKLNDMSKNDYFRGTIKPKTEDQLQKDLEDLNVNQHS